MKTIFTNNKILTYLLLTFLVVFKLSGSTTESESGIPTVEYSLIALEKVYLQLYECGIYENHRQQAQNFISGLTLPQSMSDSENAIVESLYSTLPEMDIEKAFYQAELMNWIRTAVHESTGPSPFLDAYIYWLFTRPDLQKISAKYLTDQYGLDKEQTALIYQLDPEHFLENTYNYLSAMNLAPKTEVEEEYANDPLLYGDMPSFQFTWNNKKKTRVMRIPNMARDYFIHAPEGLIAASTINEEFYHYLKLLKSKNQKQLYINLMAREGDTKTAAIEALDTDPLVGDAIVVISLDRSKKSDFYVQQGIFEEMDDAKTFKKHFLAKLTDPKGEFYWSKKVHQKGWLNKLPFILEAVHFRYFGNKKRLTHSERTEFIELTYVLIVNELVNLVNPDFLNISCKQTVDRGPTLYTMVFAYQLLHQGKTADEIYYDILLKLYSPTAVYHNRNGHFFRILRFDATLNRLVRNTSHNAPVMP